MTWAELRPAFAKRRYPCAERASAHGLIARNNQKDGQEGVLRPFKVIFEGVNFSVSMEAIKPL